MSALDGPIGDVFTVVGIAVAVRVVVGIGRGVTVRVLVAVAERAGAKVRVAVGVEDFVGLDARVAVGLDVGCVGVRVLVAVLAAVARLVGVRVVVRLVVRVAAGVDDTFAAEVGTCLVTELFRGRSVRDASGVFGAAAKIAPSAVSGCDALLVVTALDGNANAARRTKTNKALTTIAKALFGK